jgi:hypothetical protein
MKKIFIHLMIILSSTGCNNERSELQIQNLESPSKKYILEMPILEKDEMHYWTLIIKDKSGKLLYKDLDSDFVGYLNIYWCWDEHDNVWVYNSDNGFTYFWRNVNNEWEKVLWGRGHKKETDILIERPEEIKHENIYSH